MGVLPKSILQNPNTKPGRSGYGVQPLGCQLARHKLKLELQTKMEPLDALWAKWRLRASKLRLRA